MSTNFFTNHTNRIRDIREPFVQISDEEKQINLKTN